LPCGNIVWYVSCVCASATCRAFAHAVLCGYRLPNGEAVMNPGEADVAPAGSQLIFLGRGGEQDSAGL
jgi:hypothetical protein